MVLSEKEIIESLHDEGMVNCLLCNQTAFEKRIGSAIFKSWKKWIDTSAHNAPPPDFFSDKLKMMFDVTTIYDSEVPSNKRPDKMWNPVLSRERNEEHKARDFIRALGIDSSEMYIFCNCDEDGFAYDAKHTYKNYLNMANRVISKHTGKLALYNENHPGYKSGLLIYDCTEAYLEVDSITELNIEDGLVKARKPHYPWLDSAFIKPILETSLDFLIWYMPYKAHSNPIQPIEYPMSVIVDLNYPKVQEKLITYTPHLMRPL